MTEIYLYPSLSWRNQAASASPHTCFAPELSPSLMAHRGTHSNLGTSLLHQKRAGREGRATTQQSDPDTDLWAPRPAGYAPAYGAQHSLHLVQWCTTDMCWISSSPGSFISFSDQKKNVLILLPVFSRANTNGPIILINSFPYHPFASLSLALLHFNITRIFPIKSMSLCMPWHKQV